MKKNKRIIGILLSLSLMVGTSSIVNAATDSGEVQAGSALAYLRPDFVVSLNDSLQIFKDAKGNRVYPLVYGGNSYLPVRAISALMKEDIEWDNYSKTIYIGKTLSNPNKSQARKESGNVVYAQSVSQGNYVAVPEKPRMVDVIVRKDIVIMYDFEIQTFTGLNGDRVYPLTYQGSTYLPVRSISQLMGEPIEWDNSTKAILIGDGEDEEKAKVTPMANRLRAEFENAVVIYDRVTARIANLQSTADKKELNDIAWDISQDVEEAGKQTIAIRNLKDSSVLTEEESSAQKALYSFAKASESYLLVVENIAYLAAEEEDYSMLQETFLNMALDSQTKMNIARKAVDAL